MGSIRPGFSTYMVNLRKIEIVDKNRVKIAGEVLIPVSATYKNIT